MKTLSRDGGFSLIELLIAMAIMGLVAGAIFSLQTTTQRTSSTSEEVLEVQQNLRIALQRISRDIRMAGFCVPSGPIASSGDAQADSLTLQTACAAERYGRISGGTTINAGDSSTTVTLDPKEMITAFSDGDYVRIVRPSSGGQPFAGAILKVSGTDPANGTLKLGFSAVSSPVTLQDGDMVVRVSGSGATYPETIQYSLQQDTSTNDSNMYQLVRTVNGTQTDVIASKIYKSNGLQFQYLDNTGAVTASPSNIAAIRVTITGATDATQTGQTGYSGLKKRKVETVVQLKNLQ